MRAFGGDTGRYHYPVIRNDYTTHYSILQCVHHRREGNQYDKYSVTRKFEVLIGSMYHETIQSLARDSTELVNMRKIHEKAVGKHGYDQETIVTRPVGNARHMPSGRGSLFHETLTR